MSTDYFCSNEDCGCHGNHREVSIDKCDVCKAPMISMYEIEGALEHNDTTFFKKYPHLGSMDDEDEWI